MHTEDAALAYIRGQLEGFGATPPCPDATPRRYGEYIALTEMLAAVYGCQPEWRLSLPRLS